MLLNLTNEEAFTLTNILDKADNSEIVSSIITKLRDPDKYILKAKEVVDHLGNIYPSISKMLRAYKLNPRTFYQRMYRGWTLEKTLTTPIQKHNMTGMSSTVDNIHFKNLPELCRYLGVTRSRAMYWIREKGCTPEEFAKIIQKKLKNPRYAGINKSSVVDNIHFKNISELCRYLGVNRTRAVYWIYEKGYTLEEFAEVMKKKKLEEKCTE